MFGFGLIESENCEFCNRAPETLLHLICTCPVVITHWENVSACISSFLKDSFSFNNFDKVFGVQKINNTEHNVCSYLRSCSEFTKRKTEMFGCACCGMLCCDVLDSSNIIVIFWTSVKFDKGFFI